MRFRDLKKQSNKTKATEIIEPTFTYASIPDRVKAFITDMFMIYIPILYIIAYIALDGKDSFQASSLAQFVGVGLYAVIYATFLAKTGQTPGKKAYLIKVVDSKTHENISFLRALVRFVAFLFSATILLGVFLAFFRDDKKTLEDLVASTIVINTK